MTDDQHAAAEHKLLAALARREYGYQELLRKYSKEYDPEVLIAVLDKLVAKGWQSDVRYAQSYTRSAVARGKGELVIRQHLRQQQIADVLIEQALAEHDFYALAGALYDKKYRDKPATERKELAKRQRFLAGRGFSFDQINEALNHHDD